jgi:16S rRNA (adenine1518-N6/adenine1519-N6)-dimethyltransferase
MTPRRLGQHFLADAGWRARILEKLGVKAGQTWLEIGAGRGEMTQELARMGARVAAVELDAPLVERLQMLAADSPNIKVVAGDILALGFAAIEGAAGGAGLSHGKFHIYGSLPYYITSPILHRLFTWAPRIESIHVVIQREVAERLVARPGGKEYGYLSAAAQFYSRPEITLRLPPGAFRPPPKVSSALVSMRLPGGGASLGVEDDAAFLRFLHVCFAHKRKTLSNNLRAIAEPAEVAAWLAAAGLRRDARAEQLTLQQFAGLFRLTRSAVV